MIRSMFSGVSALRAHQVRMDVIGNNIANVNTVGFKKSRVTFQDMLSQNLKAAVPPSEARGGMNAAQVGLGTSLGTIDVVHTSGSPESSSNVTDLAIEGNGFFVLQDGDQRVFTRAGVFDFDGDGNLVSKLNGMRVMGYPADGTGKIIDNGSISPLRLSNNVTMDPRATDKVTFAGNLDARNVGEETVTRASRVYDSKGREHSVVVRFNKDNIAMAAAAAAGNPTNIWTYDAHTYVEGHAGVTTAQHALADIGAITADDLRVRAMETPVSVFDPTGNVGYNVRYTMVNSNDEVVAISDNGVEWNALTVADNLTFANVVTQQFSFPSAVGSNYVLSSGSTVTTTIDPANPTQMDFAVTFTPSEKVSVTVGAGDITFDTKGRYVSQSGSNADFPVPLAGDDLEIALDFAELTQYANITDATVVNQNGYTSGALDSIGIDATGLITGRFTNNLTRDLGRVVLARFSNPGGLIRSGSNNFIASPTSGDAVIGTSGNSGFGVITSNALESSNVDLSEEFTNMIITQRGFQANSRVITSSDELLQELVNLKR